MNRRVLASLLLLSLFGFTVASARVVSNWFLGPNPNFWTVQKTGNQGLADTIAGPEVWIQGSSHVVALIRANIGVCSLATWDASMNDTNWTRLPAEFISYTKLIHTDSLNQGGVTVHLWAADSVRQTPSEFGWKFARLVLTRKADSGQAADATLPGRIDSLRIGYTVYGD